MNRRMIIFPDTNLFIQCKNLDELDWSIVGDVDEIDLIVCLPVQGEIDRHKTSPSNRKARQARKIATRFRELLLTSDDILTIRSSQPTVRLQLDAEYGPSATLKDKLDYSTVDDSLVGIVQAYCEKHPDAQVSLLTHDTGPAARAKHLGIPFKLIPDGWIRPQEETAESKEVKKLQRELAALKNQEPLMVVTCENAEKTEAEDISETYTVFQPLTDDEILELMTRVRLEFPMATSFDRQTRKERPLSYTVLDDPRFALVGRGRYVPATPAEIDDYKETQYPAWLEECETFFKQLHTSLQTKVGRPSFDFVVANVGSRPAVDALVEVTARGQFKLAAKSKSQKEKEAENRNKRLRLPSPPEVPRGRWQKPSLDPIEMLRRASFPEDRAAVMPDLTPLGIHTRDPNAFYWKPERPTQPTRQFRLECSQWRHDREQKYFNGEIYFSRDLENVEGVLEVKLHAENLSRPISKKIPVRIRIETRSCLEEAEEIIEWLGVYHQ